VRAVGDVSCFLLNKEDFQAVVSASESFEQQLRRVLFDRQ
jgi:hypothetical protein